MWDWLDGVSSPHSFLRPSVCSSSWRLFTRCTKCSFHQKQVTREPFPSRASQGLRALHTNELVKAGDGWEAKDGTGTVCGNFR